MRHRNKKKKELWQAALLLIGILTVSMVLPPLEVSAAAGQQMQVSANVAGENTGPSYTVVVPSSINLGALSQQQDNLQKYEILVRSSGVKGKLSVEAPALGGLQNQSENLAFSNDFGVQSVDLSASGEEKQSEETAFYGTICITAKDVAQAKPGNYTGSTTFQITYSANGGSSLNKNDILNKQNSLKKNNVLSGNSSLKNASSLKSGTTGTKTAGKVKTGDEQYLFLWAAALTLSGGFTWYCMTKRAIQKKK